MHEKINYVQFPAKGVERVKAFFKAAFTWKSTDFGPDYTVFSDEGLDSGFFKSDLI